MLLRKLRSDGRLEPLGGVATDTAFTWNGAGNPVTFLVDPSYPPTEFEAKPTEGPGVIRLDRAHVKFSTTPFTLSAERPDSKANNGLMLFVHGLGSYDGLGNCFPLRVLTSISAGPVEEVAARADEGGLNARIFAFRFSRIPPIKGVRMSKYRAMVRINPQEVLLMRYEIEAERPISVVVRNKGDTITVEKTDVEGSLLCSFSFDNTVKV